MSFSRIGLFGKFNDSSVSDAVARVRDFLQQRNLTVLLGNTTSEEIEGDRLEDGELGPGDQIDLAVAVRDQVSLDGSLQP